MSKKNKNKNKQQNKPSQHSAPKVEPKIEITEENIGEKLIESVEDALEITKKEKEEVKAEPKAAPIATNDKKLKEAKKRGITHKTVDLNNPEYSVGEQILIRDRGLRDHEKTGKIVEVEDTHDARIYRVLLDIVKKHENPRKVNTQQRVVGVFSQQMVKVGE